MAERIIRVQSCATCPYVNANKDVLKSTCWQEIRRSVQKFHYITEPWLVPDWCPLEKSEASNGN